MDILRDESGYILVLPRPRVMAVGGKAAEKEPISIPAGNAATEPKTAACSAPHCCFYCAWCGEPILLPNDRIGAPFGNPVARKINVNSIATVCLHCRHIANYTMFRGCRGYDTRHKIVQAQMGGDTFLLNWLRCVEPSCTENLPLFVKIDREKPLGELDAAVWMWDELTCSKNHCINPIPLDPTLQLPLRSYGRSR